MGAWSLILLLFTITAAEDTAGHKEYIAKQIEFASNVYKALIELSSKPQSFAFSPVSLQFILYLAILGASGQTANELRSVSKIPVGPTAAIVEDYLSNLLQHNATQVITDIYSDAADPLQSYIDTIKEFNVNSHIIKNSSTVPLPISQWVSAHTGHTIQQVRNRMDIILSNVVSFKAPWGVSLRRSLHLFNSTKDESENQMLVGSGRFNYMQDPSLKCDYVELPFEDTDVSLVVAVPFGQNIENLDKNIASVLQKSFSMRTTEELNLHIPRYYSKPINIYFQQVLKRLPLTAPFREEAKFDKLSKALLKIDEIVQSTGIIVNPQEAHFSSASVSVARKRLTLRSVNDVIARNPFVYYVKHKELGLLILGKFVVPEKRN